MRRRTCPTRRRRWSSRYAAIKAAALQFQKLPKDVSNVAVPSGYGLRLTDVQVICRDSVVATLAQLTHHRSATVRTELRAMFRDMHLQYGVCGQILAPSASCATHAGSTWVDRVLWAMGTLLVGLLMPSSVYSCVHAHLLQAQWAGQKWASESYTLKGRDISVLLGPRTDAAVQSLAVPQMTYYMRGPPVLRLGSGPSSSRSVMRIICNFLTREWGPIS